MDGSEVASRPDRRRGRPPDGRRQGQPGTRRHIAIGRPDRLRQHLQPGQRHHVGAVRADPDRRVPGRRPVRRGGDQQLRHRHRPGALSRSRELRKLELLNAPAARVRRDGVETRRSRSRRWSATTSCCWRRATRWWSTARSSPSVGLEIDESLLTGEADPIDKAPGDQVLSGSFVNAGSGEYRATKVGAESYANTLAAEAKKFTAGRQRAAQRHQPDPAVPRHRHPARPGCCCSGPSWTWRSGGRRRCRAPSPRRWPWSPTAWCC